MSREWIGRCSGRMPACLLVTLLTNACRCCLLNLQGKVDPARRNYEAIFAELAAHRAELATANLSVTILGKAGGRKDKVLLELPQELVDAGLLRHYDSLPFQVGFIEDGVGNYEGRVGDYEGLAGREQRRGKGGV